MFVVKCYDELGFVIKEVERKSWSDAINVAQNRVGKCHALETRIFLRAEAGDFLPTPLDTLSNQVRYNLERALENKVVDKRQVFCLNALYRQGWVNIENRAVTTNDKLTQEWSVRYVLGKDGKSKRVEVYL